MSEDRLYFRQLLAGRDIAASDPVASQMVNFVYLIGDRATREAVVVDPAYDVAGILETAAGDGVTVTSALLTHYHPDHVGGSLGGHAVEGVRELLQLQPTALHVQRDEAEWIARATGVSRTDLEEHDSGDVVQVGDVEVELIHTPGHTPGSQCFYVADRLVAGDTLFLDGCGRTDLPGGDAEQLYYSLTQRLARIPDDAILYPGHLYSMASSASMGITREHNAVFKPRTAEDWLRIFGA